MFSLSSIITSHLVLNLKQAVSPHTQSQLSIYSEPIFATNSFIGNLGAPLRVGEEDMDYEEDGEYELQGLEGGHEQNCEDHNEMLINTQV